MDPGATCGLRTGCHAALQSVRPGCSTCFGLYVGEESLFEPRVSRRCIRGQRFVDDVTLGENVGQHWIDFIRAERAWRVRKGLARRVKRSPNLPDVSAIDEMAVEGE